MARRCEVCGKSTISGNKISHSNRHSRRVWRPNIRNVKAVVNGTPKKLHVCTRCLRSGKVQRAI
ncbi:MAG: 50S ribosomal protein L28 [Gracilibacteraceae bacterium]|jgi:large subunit ribosomal protein L28|nr:50S ribosomal protein L28 [Gracilibacteraceae bacterium]